MKNLLRNFLIGMLLSFGLVFFTVDSVAEDTLLEGTQFSKQYLVQLSGTVMNETFSGAKALITLLPPAVGGEHPYQIIIVGFPKKNSRNSFFWNADYSEMTAIANDITCEIKRTFIKPVPMHFFFLSPELLKHTGALEMYGDEGKKAATAVALPTMIRAQAGKLKLRIYSNSISGTVWMKGYDDIEKAYVQYSARFYGKKSYKLAPRDEVQKATTVGE